MNRFLICLCLLTTMALNIRAQEITRVHTDQWNGFQRVRFSIGGHEAWYVKPDKPLPGNPWIWRASFPDWHTEMDSLLLSKGMYVVFINVDNQYGSPAAMQAWEQLYYYLTDSLSFAAKASVEGVSRGGLYVYAWAKRNPDKVNCIYNEAPVCDFKSWPGGKGKGGGDSASWKQLQQVFSMTEEEALAFDDNPIDHLEGLASFKVPVLHVIGAFDKIVPSDENTFILARRYASFGGPVSIYPVTDGPQELSGHHFPIEHAEQWANFILSHAYPVNAALPYDHYFHIRSGLTNVYRRITQNKQATIAFLGGSITYNPGWRDKVCSWFREHFPETAFHFISAGIPSLGSPAHAFRLQRDILDSGKIDLMFVEAAVNDRGNGTDSLTQVRSLEGIVRHALGSNPLMDVVFMSFADPDKTRDYNEGQTPVETVNQELVADHYGMPSINLDREIRDKINHREFSWAYDFKDLHPSPFGQELYAATIKRLLIMAFDRAGENNTLRKLPAPLDKGDFDRGRYLSPDHANHDQGWLLEDHWTPKDGLSTREGFVNVKMLTTTRAGASLTLSFTGTAVGMAIVSGADAGIISYSIDKGDFKKMDLFTPWSEQLHLPWYLLLGTDLKKGKHILRLKMAADKNSRSKGNACRIVHFLLND
ncbi:MAG: GDSL-type esterase/lipase family protein [Bacteroidota bacterium]|nr:GDSL-type esterase/lipase family protein [Bacteroidota bacterium]